MTSNENSSLLRGTRIVSIALNAPGPVAAARLTLLGAEVTKVEPPGGDAMSMAAPAWYESLSRDQTVIRLDLKDTGDRARFDHLLNEADLLLASFRPSALRRLGLGWDSLHAAHPRLCFVGIIGHAEPEEEKSGHDLTYQAGLGMLRPPEMPASLFVDLAGGERAVSTALALLYRKARTGKPGCEWVSLHQCAQDLAQPMRVGLTAPAGWLGGGYPLYGFYRASDGWVAIAALEPHFASRLLSELNLGKADRAELERIFLERSAGAWERWAAERDLPLVAVRAAG